MGITDIACLQARGMQRTKYSNGWNDQLTSALLTDDERANIDGNEHLKATILSPSRIFDLILTKDIDKIKEILRKLKDEDQINIFLDGKTLLHCAAKAGLHDIVDMLLQRGAEVNVVDSHQGLSALHFAAIEGYYLCARRLLAFGANPTLLSQSTQRGALHYAVQSASIECVRALVSNVGLVGLKNVDTKMVALQCVNMRDIDGHTPLHLACIEGNVSIVNILLQVRHNS